MAYMEHLNRWVRSTDLVLVELACLSVITQKPLGQIRAADTNLFPFSPASSYSESVTV